LQEAVELMHKEEWYFGEKGKRYHAEDMKYMQELLELLPSFPPEGHVKSFLHGYSLCFERISNSTLPPYFDYISLLSNGSTHGIGTTS
jgi:hypothetical protein